MDTLAKGKALLDGSRIRCLVKAYLDREKIILKRFKGNIAGAEWVHFFIKRNNFTKRIADNAKAEVSKEISSAYFYNLEQSSNEILPENIFNKDEADVTDDHGSKTVIVIRGQNQMKRKTQHSKTSTSIMFCGNAAGQFLPPIVVYKSENLYEKWEKVAQKLQFMMSHLVVGSIIELLISVFFLMFGPSLTDRGRVALIGENLGSHFSKAVIDKCFEENISFVCLPPNATHLCQQLDLAVFRPVKSEWRDVLDTWHKESKSKEKLPKTVLPTLLSKLMTRLKSSNLIAGFRASGIHLLNRNEVLKCIPSSKQVEDVNLEVLNNFVL